MYGDKIPFVLMSMHIKNQRIPLTFDYQLWSTAAFLHPGHKILKWGKYCQEIVIKAT